MITLNPALSAFAHLVAFDMDSVLVVEPIFYQHDMSIASMFCCQLVDLLVLNLLELMELLFFCYYYYVTIL